METICVMSKLLITSGFLACSKLPKNIELAKTEHGIQGTANASSAFLLCSVLVLLWVVPLGTRLYLAVSSFSLLFLCVIRCGNRRSHRCIPPKIQETSTWMTKNVKNIHTVRNLHFLSKNSTLIIRENYRFFWGWKTRENVVVLDFLAVDHFDFTRKIVKKKKNGWKNRENVWFFVKIDFLDKNLPFGIVC